MNLATEPSLGGSAVGGDTLGCLGKAWMNLLQPPDFRNKSSLTSTLKTLLFFTALMITVPIGYFTTKSYVFEGIFGMSNRESYFFKILTRGYFSIDF
ncbi:LOW QUALITY PROTEIN: vacuolar ATPase assembly integral membrane protein VMA21 [Myotis yumanensis]|uniref:LOW QUALITY PROTEIN: vacuolar ATPase assembly integral membrane protein VMA21 n=1 Tax=Myotis yumanensis TaxID=159337 RepID=UPI0038D1F9C5